MAKDMLGDLTRKLVDLTLETIKVIYDLAEKLSGEAGQEWLVELKKFLRKEKCWTGVIREIFLKIISGGEDIILDAVNGTETLVDAKDVFTAGIDHDFVSWDADEKGSATAETPVDVYEMTEDATFSQMFGSLNSDVNKLCFTQHQIKNFVKKHCSWLRRGGFGTFFLFSSNDQFFVAPVNFYSDVSLTVRVHRLELGHVWDAERRHRVVVPRLAETL